MIARTAVGLAARASGHGDRLECGDGLDERRRHENATPFERSVLKWRDASRSIGESLRLVYGAFLRFQAGGSPRPCRTPKPITQSLSAAPPARRRPAQLREAARGRARGLRRGRHRGDARRHRPPRRRRHRHALPPLPDAPAPARGGLRRRGRGDGRVGRRPGRRSRPGTRSSPGCTSTSATRRRSARWPRSCSPTSTPTPRSSRPAAPPIVGAGDMLLERAQKAGVVRPDTNFSDVGRIVGGIAAIRGDRARADRAHARHRARRLRYSPR